MAASLVLEARVIALDLAPSAGSDPHPDRWTGDLFEVELPPGSFDLIYSFQTFEHLPEPRPTLERLLSLVRPGGLLLVHTDLDTPQRREAGFLDWFYVMPPDHCSYYRLESFRRVLDELPGEIVWHDLWTVLVRRDRPAYSPATRP